MALNGNGGFLRHAASLVLILLCGSLYAGAAVYYVDNTASCPGNGTQQSPWCSLSSVNSHAAFQPGDQILLKRGDTFLLGSPTNTPLAPLGSGTSTAPAGIITIGAYGTGARPILDGQLIGAETANGGASVTYTANTVTDSSRTWTANQWVGAYVSSGTSSGHVVANSATTLVLAANWSPSTPSAGAQYYLVLPASGIKLTNQSYWAIRDLEIRNVFYGINLTSTSGVRTGFRISGVYTHDNATGIYIRPAQTITPPPSDVSFSDIRIDDIESTHDNVGIQVINASDSVINRLFAHDLDGRTFETKAFPCGWGAVGISQYLSPPASDFTLINSRIIRGGACLMSPTGAITSGMANVTFVNSVFTNTPFVNMPDQSGVDFESNAQNGSNEGNHLRNSYIADNAGPGVEVLNLPAGGSCPSWQNITDLEISGNLLANNGWGGGGVSFFDNWGGAIFTERISPCDNTPVTNAIGVADNLVVAQNGASLTSALISGASYNSLPISTTAAWLPPAGSTITLTDPTGVHTQNIVVASGSTITTLYVNSFTANFAYSVGTGVGLTPAMNSQSPPNFIVQGHLHPYSTSAWTIKNNLDLGSGTGTTRNIGAANNLAYAGYQFGAFQQATPSASQWSYQYSTDDVNWTNLGYYNSASLTNPVWQPSSGVASPNIGVFEQYPSSVSSTWVARAWTAPESGAVAIRGRILRSDTACDGGAVAKITRNGTTIWGPQTVNASTDPGNNGIVTNLDHLAVTVGDVLRFETSINGVSQCAVSWSPGLGFTNLATNGGFEATSPNCLSGWTQLAGTSGCITAGVPQGSQAAYVQANGTTVGEDFQTLSGWTAGQNLTLAAFGRVGAWGQSGVVGLWAEPSGAFFCTVTFTSPSWTYLSTSGCTVPAGTTGMSAAFLTGSTANGTQMFADGISVTPYNPNLLFNPSFEQNLTGWTKLLGNFDVVPIAWAPPDLTQAGYVEADGSSIGEAYQYVSGWSVGEDLTLSGYGAVGGAGQTGDISLWAAGPNVVVCSLSYTQAGSYLYKSTTGCTVPTGTTGLAVILKTAVSTNGHRLYADNISVTRTQ